MPEEEAAKEKPVERINLSPKTAKATMERLQNQGILPRREEAPPIRKAFPQNPEKRAKILKSYPGEETILPEIKEELTQKAQELNARATGRMPFKKIIEAEEKLRASQTEYPQATTLPPEKEVKIPSQDVAPAAAPWIKKEEPRMVGGTHEAAVRQVGYTGERFPKKPTTEQVAAKQSIEQGQQIKRRWYDRIPFLRALRGEKSPS